MKRFFVVGALLLQLLPMSAVAACEGPSPPALPDGATATAEEIKAAYSEIKSYMSGAEAFLACLDRQTNRTSRAARQLLNVEYNQKVDEMQRVGAEFNAAVEAFNARH